MNFTHMNVASFRTSVLLVKALLDQHLIILILATRLNFLIKVDFIIYDFAETIHLFYLCLDYLILSAVHLLH